jgi:hypothetical protein
MRCSARSIIVACSVLLSALFARAASAEAPLRVAVYFEGRGADKVRADVVHALGTDVAVVASDDTERGIHIVGVTHRLAAALATDAARDRLAAKLKRAAQLAGADAFIAGTVPQRGTGDAPTIVVRVKGEGAFDTVQLDRKDTDATRTAQWSEFLDLAFPERHSPPAAVEEATPDPDAATTSPAPEPAEPDRPVSAPHEKPSRPNRFDRATAIVGVAYDGAFRSFSFTDPITHNLRPYRVALRPGIAANAEVYPFARSDVGVLKDVGVVLGVTQTFGFDSETADHGRVSTSFRAFDVGVAARIHTGKSEAAPLLGVRASYVGSSFGFGDSVAVAAGELPEIRYHLLRAELDARVPFGAFAAFAGVSYLQVLDAEPMQSRFPHESVHGVGARVGASARVLPWLEARLEARYDRIFYDLRPVPGDEYVAGGALDQYESLNVGGAAIF